MMQEFELRRGPLDGYRISCNMEQGERLFFPLPYESDKGSMVCNDITLTHKQLATEWAEYVYWGESESYDIQTLHYSSTIEGGLYDNQE